MSLSKRAQEGYLIIDHRHSPGISTPVTQKDGTLAPIVHEGQCWESATTTCSHCQYVVVLNPLRTRPRHHCLKCDAYICDACAAIGGCQPFTALADATLEAAVKRVTEF